MKGYVLAGGLSRRMGVDKRFVEVDGETMISRVVAAVGEALGGDGVSVVAKDLPPAVGPVRFVRDQREERAALSGVEAALDDAGPEETQVLVVACDYPLIASATLRRLIDAAALREEAITLAASDGHLHPLVAVWPTSALGQLRSRVAAGEWSVMALVERAGYFAVSSDELQAAPGELRNVNVPEDLKGVRRRDGE